MKVILCENIEKLGNTGDTITVKEGYARNFLIPKKLALQASEQNLKAVENIKKKKQLAADKEKEKAQELADRMQKMSCTIAMHAGEEDKLFGAATTADVQQAFEAEGVKLDKRQILLDEPMKELGVYNIPIKLHPEVTANVKVWIVKS